MVLRHRYQRQHTAEGPLLVAASDASSRSKVMAWKVCDGIADNVEIQAAIDALPAGGGKVVLSEGTFTIAAAINMASGLTIEGQGYNTLVKVAAADLNINGFSVASTCTNVVIRNLRLDGTKASQSTGGQGIRVDWSATDWLIENVWVENWKGIGIASSGATRIICRSCRSTSNDADGFSFDSTTYSTFLQCFARTNGGKGFVAGGDSDYCNFIDCLADGNTGTGGFNISMSDSCRLIGCAAVNNSAGYGIATQGEDPATGDPLNGCQLIGCYAYNNLLDGIDNYHADSVTMNGCRSQGNGRSGFTLDSTADWGQIIGCVSLENARNGIHIFRSDHARIEGCLIQNNSYGDAGNYHGIHIEDDGNGNGDHALITGNRILDTQGTKTQEYGIKMTDTDYAYVFNNNLDGNRTGAISTAGSNNIVRGNVGVTPTTVTSLATLVAELEALGLVVDGL